MKTFLPTSARRSLGQTSTLKIQIAKFKFFQAWTLETGDYNYCNNCTYCYNCNLKPPTPDFRLLTSGFQLVSRRFSRSYALICADVPHPGWCPHQTEIFSAIRLFELSIVGEDTNNGGGG